MNLSTAFSQAEGVIWMNLFGSKGSENSPGFVTDSSGAFYFALTFEKSLIVPGTSDTLIPAGGYDGLIAKYNNQGNLNDYWWLKSNGFISINSINNIGNNIFIGGCFQDTLLIQKRKTNKETLIASTPVNLSGYLLELSKTGEVIDTQLTDTTAQYSLFNHLTIKNNEVAASGIILEEDNNNKYNTLHYSTGGNEHYLRLGNERNQKLNDLILMSDLVLFGGSFNDTIYFDQDTLIPKSNHDAFLSGIFLNSDSSFTKLLKSDQNAEIATLIEYDSVLWVGVNFNDTLTVQDTIKFSSKGARDILLLKYDSNINLASWFQIGGQLDDRLDKIIINNQLMYLLTNISSPATYLSNPDSVHLLLEQDNLRGNAALFSLDSLENITHLWLIQQDWANKITQVAKVNETETILSGVFDTKMSVDSVPYFTKGGQDAYFFRVSDACLNSLKASPMMVQFCEGDTIFIPDVYITDDNYLKIDEENEQGIYITETCSYRLKIKESCGCINVDSIVFQATDGKKSNAIPFSRFDREVLSFFNDSIQIELNYLGDCSILEDDILSVAVVPNPFDSNADIEVLTTESGSLTYQLFDMYGKPISTQMEQDLFVGSSTIKLPIQKLTNGSYLLKVIYQTDDYTHNESIILLKK
jgi:hypothetical protein